MRVRFGKHTFIIFEYENADKVMMALLQNFRQLKEAIDIADKWNKDDDD